MSMINMEFRGESPDPDKAREAFIGGFNQVFAVMKSLSKKSEMTALAAEYESAFLRYLELGLGINHRFESSTMMKGAPIWFNSLRLMEMALAASTNLKERTAYLGRLWNAIRTQKPDFSLVDGKALTGVACFTESWGLAATILASDASLELADTSVFYYAVTNSSQAKRIAMSIEVMNALYEVDQKIDRPSARNGATALMRACAFSNVEQIRWLLDKGADIDARDTRSHATPLVHALDSKYGIGDFGDRKRVAEVLALLIEKGADVDWLPDTKEDFGRLVINCKALKGEDREHYKTWWKQRTSGDKGKTPKAKSNDNASADTKLEGGVSPADIRALHAETDFLVMPNASLYAILITYLESRGITRFSHLDIARFVDPKWNGIGMDDLRRDISPKTVEKLLNKFIVGGVKKGVNLHREPGGDYVVLSQSRPGKVVRVQVD